MTVVPSYSDEVPLEPEEPQSEIVEPLSWEEEPSLGLQIASGALLCSMLLSNSHMLDWKDLWEGWPIS